MDKKLVRELELDRVDARNEVNNIAFTHEVTKEAPSKSTHDAQRKRIRGMEKVLTKREKELSILKQHTDLLKRLKPDTYWVLNIESAKQLKKFIKWRNALMQEYKLCISAIDECITVAENIINKSK